MQAILATLVQFVAGMIDDDEKKGRSDIAAAAREMIDRSAIPELAAADQAEMRAQAKALSDLLVIGRDRH